jgi:hypothetical protein
LSSPYWLPFLSEQDKAAFRFWYRDVAWEENDVGVFSGDWLGLRTRLLESLRFNRDQVNTIRTRTLRWQQLREYAEHLGEIRKALKTFLNRIKGAVTEDIPEAAAAYNSFDEPISRCSMNTLQKIAAKYRGFHDWLHRWAEELNKEAVLPLLESDRQDPMNFDGNP